MNNHIFMPEAGVRSMSGESYFNECRECGKIIPFGTICLSCIKKFNCSDSETGKPEVKKNIYHCGHVDCTGHEKRFEECYTKE